MTLLWFDIIADTDLCRKHGMPAPRVSGFNAEARHERQTVPMLLAVTALYVSLAAMFGRG